MSSLDSPELLSQVIRNIAIAASISSQDIVLVGGQAVAFWCEFFDIALPKDIAALTTDVDFLATHADIFDVESSLSFLYPSKLKLASMDDASSNSGKMLIYSPELKNPVEIDFMRFITGVGYDEAIKNAIKIDISCQSISILSPIMLMRSKLCNIGAHPQKRNKEGLAQAQLAIQIAKKYLDNRVLENIKPPYLEFEEVIRFCMSDPALYVNHFFNFDPMDAIPIDRLVKNDAFLVKRLPVAFNQIEVKRQKFSAMADRMQHSAKVQ